MNDYEECVEHCMEPWNTPICDEFRDNDQGICMDCGHLKACHKEDLK